MGFFKDFKDDLSQAVNELITDNDIDTEDISDQMVNTLDSEETDNEEAENEMKEWLEEFAGEDTKDETEEDDTEKDEDETAQDNDIEEGDGDKKLKEVMEDGDEDMEENIDLELLDALNAEEEKNVEETKNDENKVRAASVTDDDEVTVISKGTTIDGNISSDGSLEIMGNVTGDVECLGKLTIIGKVIGNSTAAEVYANTDRLEGSINSEGSVKVGLGTVVIGDIVGTSAVIAGAVKGEIDINGPIVIDSTAIIMGNIKAKSIQINNGAVIEGFCSLAYSDVNLDNVFD